MPAQPPIYGGIDMRVRAFAGTAALCLLVPAGASAKQRTQQYNSTELEIAVDHVLYKRGGLEVGDIAVHCNRTFTNTYQCSISGYGPGDYNRCQAYWQVKVTARGSKIYVGELRDPVFSVSSVCVRYGDPG